MIEQKPEAWGAVDSVRYGASIGDSLAKRG